SPVKPHLPILQPLDLNLDESFLIPSTSTPIAHDSSIEKNQFWLHRKSLSPYSQSHNIESNASPKCSADTALPMPSPISKVQISSHESDSNTSLSDISIDSAYNIPPYLWSIFSKSPISADDHDLNTSASSVAKGSSNNDFFVCD